MLPNFFIVGAAKAGTTSLYQYLSAHRDVFMCEPKEPNYFAHEDIDTQNLYYNAYAARTLQEYKSLFVKATTHKAVGEASVSYLYYPGVPLRIQHTIPDARIIIMLRNPIERGYSHYLMDQRLGFVDLDYWDIVHKTSKNPRLHLYYQQYVQLGLYHNQVARYLSTFGRNQVRIYLQDDLKINKQAVLNDLFTFLQLSPGGYVHHDEIHNKYMNPRNSLIARAYASQGIRKTLSRLLPERIKQNLLQKAFDFGGKPKLSIELRDFLQDIYREDIIKLEELISKDLSQWRQI